jgi:hypothetical protein
MKPHVKAQRQRKRYVAYCDVCVKPIKPGESLYHMETPTGDVVKICKVCLKEWKRARYLEIQKTYEKLLAEIPEK